MTIKPKDAAVIYNVTRADKEQQQITPTHPVKITAETSSETPKHVAQDAVAPNHDLPVKPAKESGGQAGLDPTRYGDWEKKGRCTDF